MSTNKIATDHRNISELRNLTQRFFRFIIPTILSMVVFSVYTMVDGIFVARGVGEKALAAVNLASPYNACMFASGLLVAVGMGTVISIELGMGHKERASQLFTQNLLVTAGVGILITVVTLCNLEAIARFLGATPDTLAYVMDYVGLIAPFAVFFLCSYNMEIIVKCDGTPMLGMIGVTCAGLTNLVLDWLFVMVFHWGVRGAAFATGLAQVVSTVLYLAYFRKWYKTLHFVKFHWDFRIYRRTLPLGVGDGVTEFSNGIVIFLFNRAILHLLGEDGVVIYTVIGYVNTLMIMVMSGTAQGMQPVCSFHYGKRELHHCEYLRRLGLGVCLVFGVLGWAVCYFGGEWITAMFLKRSSPLFATGTVALRKYSWAFLIMGINIVSAAFFTSIERASRSFPISFGRGLVFPLLAVSIVSWTGQANLIWYAGAMAEAAALVLTALFTSLYHREMRKRKELDET